MASVVASSLSVVAPSAAAVSDSTAKSFTGLRPSTLLASKAPQPLKNLSNGHRVNCMKVWEPYANKKFETLSYLPLMSKDQIAKQVDYICSKGWIPCLEFDRIGHVYREHFHGSGYYDGRYWTMWKLPMFGCKDSAAVLREIVECEKAYPKCFIRVLGFDRVRQVQLIGFVVHQPEIEGITV